MASLPAYFFSAAPPAAGGAAAARLRLAPQPAPHRRRARHQSRRCRRRRCGCRRCRGSIRRRLELFGVAGRRHDGDEGRVAMHDRAHVRRQLDVAQVLRVADLETRDVDVDRFRDRVRRAHHLDVVGDDVDGAAALHAGRLVDVHHVHRDAHADRRTLAEAEEVDMDRIVAHRVDLEVARNGAVLLAVDLDVADADEEAARMDAVLELVEIERDRDRGLVVAVDHARHAAFTTHGPGGPLACPRTRRRLQFIDGRHSEILQVLAVGSDWRSCCRGVPPGVSGPRTARL